MDPVLHDLRLRHFVEPDAQTTFYGIKGGGIVIEGTYRIAEDFCPEAGNTVVISTVET
jgi:hypothetical protein